MQKILRQFSKITFKIDLPKFHLLDPKSFDPTVETSKGFKTIS